MAHSDEFLRDIEECRIPKLRAHLEELESGKILERRPDPSQTDVTQARILWFKRLTANYEAIAAQLRAREAI